MTFKWDFGDGSTSTDPNPTHTYNTAGTFQASMVVLDEWFLQATQPVTVMAIGNPPRVKITQPVDNYRFGNGEVVATSAQVSDDVDPANKLTYAWEARLVHNNHFHPDTGMGATPLWAFQFSSFTPLDDRTSYELYLTVTNTHGLSATDMIRVRAGYIDFPNGPPQPKITVNGPLTGSAPLTIEVSGKDTYDPDTDFCHLLWDWGDGSPTNTDLTTRHTFGAPGSYTITLTATDAFAAKGTATANVVVTAPTASVPYITPAGGLKYGDVQCTMATLTATGQIRYTLDGSTPNQQSILYSGPFTIKDQGQATVIKAITFAPDIANSAVSTATFRFGELPVDNLQGYWSLDSLAGGVATDCSGFGNDAVASAGATSPRPTTGRVGGAAMFDGQMGLQAGNDSSLGCDGGQLTIGLFFQRTHADADELS
eukprot:TRINITY_DN2342_c0_g1_i2.p1 TRINITY_DN2342_c0_g1~~TRINITY_DN2342_c0_g1_i2.p1  ORF type:complete len:426 (-),score=134.00 TRINITY_DN2342_c0_g1_i2:79-1356(-)